MSFLQHPRLSLSLIIQDEENSLATLLAGNWRTERIKTLYKNYTLAASSHLISIAKFKMCMHCRAESWPLFKSPQQRVQNAYFAILIQYSLHSYLLLRFTVDVIFQLQSDFIQVLRYNSTLLNMPINHNFLLSSLVSTALFAQRNLQAKEK